MTLKVFRDKITKTSGETKTFVKDKASLTPPC